MEPLTVPGTLDSLKAVAQYVVAASTAAGLDKKTTYRLRLAIDEIATNIVIHGYEETGREGSIYLFTDIDAQTLTVTLEDQGIPYNPNTRAEPEDLSQPIEQRQIGGLGVYLAIQGVDKFLYEYEGDRNRNIFVMNRPVAPKT